MPLFIYVYFLRYSVLLVDLCLGGYRCLFLGDMSKDGHRDFSKHLSSTVIFIRPGIYTIVSKYNYSSALSFVLKRDGTGIITYSE